MFNCKIIIGNYEYTFEKAVQPLLPSRYDMPAKPRPYQPFIGVLQDEPAKSQIIELDAFIESKIPVVFSPDSFYEITALVEKSNGTYLVKEISHRILN